MGEPDYFEYAAGKFASAATGIRDLAAIEELAVYQWRNDHTSTGALEIITNAQIYHNLEAGVVHYVTSVDIEVLTANKDCYFELGTTTAVDGGGVFTAITPRWFLDRGAASSAGTFQERVWTIPIRVEYSLDAVMCITFRIQGADAATHVLMAWKGWER